MFSSRPPRYRRIRNLLLVSGLLVIGLIAVSMVIREVDPIEIIATLLFAPIYLGLVLYGGWVGLALGVGASIAYVGMRMPAVEYVGVAPLAGLLASRTIGYLAFGGLGGWAAARVLTSLNKLELVDDVDDATGLGNHRSLLDRLKREQSRVRRYGTDFTVVFLEFTLDEHEGRARKRHRNQLRNLGLVIDSSARESDHPAHIALGEHHVIAIVLPQTGLLGGEVVLRNLTGLIREQFDVPVSGKAFADDDPTLDEYVNELVEVQAP
ncbi:MAG: hypothetical protein ACLGHX_01530 [Acidimicrobiia bacterium]